MLKVWFQVWKRVRATRRRGSALASRRHQSSMGCRARQGAGCGVRVGRIGSVGMLGLWCPAAGFEFQRVTEAAPARGGVRSLAQRILARMQARAASGPPGGLLAATAASGTGRRSTCLQLTAWRARRSQRVPPPARPCSSPPGRGRWWRRGRCWPRGPSQRGAGPRGRSACAP